MRQAIFWLKILAVAGSFGTALGLAPAVIIWLLDGDVPVLGNRELKALAVLFVLPSVCAWASMAQGLINRSLATALICGLVWPFVTLFMGANLNALLHFDVDFLSHVAFMLWVLVIPLGCTAGVVMHRIVNAQYRPCPDVQSVDHVSDKEFSNESYAHPWVACSLSILPGLGQLYNGEAWKAGLYYVLGFGGGTFLVRFVLLHAPFEGPYNVFLAGAVVFAVYGAIMTEAYWAACYRTTRSWMLSNNRWFVFFAILFVMGFVVKPIMLGFLDRHYANPAKIYNSTMAPTILPGDRFLVDQRAYSPTQLPRRGHIIVFQVPGQGSFIRRVAGVPGDTIEIRDHEILINGSSQGKRDHAYFPMGETTSELPDGPANSGPVKVPEGELFVVTDNRESAWDSRVFGTIPKERVWGRIAMIYWAWVDDDSFIPRWDRIGNRFPHHGLPELRTGQSLGSLPPFS